ncbi:hypothetical protein TL16_g04927 [Triparma laevis f. inornata]|uniref:rRNA adenine N(6)-methyltransferase n=1 Tax=Triparma laevis f. inornata TaxID=1714386 RepID=A0A9W7EA14_9STRA|nr:hypothetical protein TL16_g04927 [Triparma laevis f. inornata]
MPHLRTSARDVACRGWVSVDGEYVWEDAGVVLDQQKEAAVVTDAAEEKKKLVPPKLQSGAFKPKQSLGQNFLTDQNTINRIVHAFGKDATSSSRSADTIDGLVELGPGPGALTQVLIQEYGTEEFRCIEIDQRSVELLNTQHPGLDVRHMDVLQVDYPSMKKELNGESGQGLAVIGNLPYYITSQILFALADASHQDAIRSATVTMQWEVGERLVAERSTKAYGILSVVFQIYAETRMHFKIPPTVFYPKPKVDSGLVGLTFVREEVSEGPRRFERAQRSERV